MFGLFLVWAIINDVVMNIHVRFLNFQITSWKLFLNNL